MHLKHPEEEVEGEEREVEEVVENFPPKHGWLKSTQPSKGKMKLVKAILCHYFAH